VVFFAVAGAEACLDLVAGLDAIVRLTVDAGDPGRITLLP
jgi:hypothetical protein